MRYIVNMKNWIFIAVILFFIPSCWGRNSYKDALSPSSFFSEKENHYEDPQFIEEAETLWKMRAKNTFNLNNRDFDSLQKSQADMEKYLKKLALSPDFICYEEGTSDSLDQAISKAWRVTPASTHFALKETIRLFSENIMQHAYNSGQLYIKWNKILGLISIAVFDQGPGFPKDKNGIPQILLGANNTIKQRENSPGRGVAMGMIMDSVNELQILTQGYLWKKSFPVTIKKESISRMKGTMMIAVIDTGKTETDLNSKSHKQQNKAA